ncbi:DRS7B reductase, partial [Emberiza fucata]|nr:DRS7B reductase [Emberiza fucata]
LSPCGSRKTAEKGKLMDFTSTVIIPLLFGSLGIFALFRLLQWVRMRTYLQEAVVVITGATSGLGRECAKAFHAAGSRLVLCGRDSEKLKGLVQELCAVKNHRKNNVVGVPVELQLSWEALVTKLSLERVSCRKWEDVLVAGKANPAAHCVGDQSHHSSPCAASGTGNLLTALLPSMIKRRQGHIVAISSVQGKISIPFRSAYAASKHATQAFFDCLRAEVEQYDIEVTVVSPGYIQTNLSLNAVTADGSRYGVMDKTTAEGQTAAEVAQVVLNAVGQKKKEVLVAGLTPCLAVYLRNLCPRLFFTLMASRAKKERKAKGS